MTNNQFSIITLTKNSEKYICETLKSLERQSNKDWELIVQDCLSTDNTLRLIKDFHFDHISVICEPDDGIYDALNRGLRRCRGDIIGILHSGDQFCDSEVLSMVYETFVAGDFDIVYGDIVYFKPGTSNNLLRQWRSGEFFKWKLNFGWMPPHTATFIKRDIYEEFGDYDSSFRVSGDYDFLIRVLNDKSVKVGYLDKTLVKMMSGGVSTAYNFYNIWNIFGEDLRAARANKLSGLFTVLCKKIRKVSQFLG